MIKKAFVKWYYSANHWDGLKGWEALRAERLAEKAFRKGWEMGRREALKTKREP
jgi:hypothetical protein